MPRTNTTFFALNQETLKKQNAKESLSREEEIKALSEQVQELLGKLDGMQVDLKKRDKKIHVLKQALEKKKTHSKVNEKHKYTETVQVIV